MPKRTSNTPRKNVAPRAIRAGAAMPASSPSDDESGAGLTPDFLCDPATIAPDLKIATELARAGPCWGDLTESKKRQIVDRLMVILLKQHVTVTTKDGPREDEVIADKNAIAVSRVLAIMEAQNQKDEHLRDRLDVTRSKRKPDGPGVQNNVQIDINEPSNIQAIIQEALRSGACEQLIELDDKRRTTEANRVSGDIRDVCEPGTLGRREPSEADQSSHLANAQGSGLAADPDH